MPTIDSTFYDIKDIDRTLMNWIGVNENKLFEFNLLMSDTNIQY